MSRLDPVFARQTAAGRLARYADRQHVEYRVVALERCALARLVQSGVNAIRSTLRLSARREAGGRRIVAN